MEKGTAPRMLGGGPTVHYTQGMHAQGDHGIEVGPRPVPATALQLGLHHRPAGALDRLWQQRRERAAYEADRAVRQYHAVTS